ncbi:9888_t:CDS:2, partial [Scutellospora calospora]
MAKIDSKIRLLSKRTINNKIAFNYHRNIDILQHEIVSTCKTATITSDLWTSQAIHQFLLSKYAEFNLEDKIVYAITDNGANM